MPQAISASTIHPLARPPHQHPCILPPIVQTTFRPLEPSFIDLNFFVSQLLLAIVRMRTSSAIGTQLVYALVTELIAADSASRDTIVFNSNFTVKRLMQPLSKWVTLFCLSMGHNVLDGEPITDS